MPRKKKAPPRIAVMDFETDPFEYGQEIKPFACGLYFDTDDVRGHYVHWWGDDCVSSLFDYLADIKTPLVIYAHNGGKFDFRFFVDRLENPVLIIHGRITKAKCGIHEFRDSFSIIPVSLETANNKKKIDYSHMRRSEREKHRAEILDYLYHDCKYLFELVFAFVSRFGPRLTIASTAARELRKYHPQTPGNESHDSRFRQYYMGGRVQCFESGIVRGAFKMYDVNSMYPAAMKLFDHPKGRQWIRPAVLKLDKDGWLCNFPNRVFFCRANVEIIGRYGVFPMREMGTFGGLNFSVKTGEILTTSHELRAALSLGLCRVIEITDAYVPREVQSFTAYVDVYAAEKRSAKKNGDKIGELFAKLLLNSAYGRFGINPYEFFDYVIVKPGDARPSKDEGFAPYQLSDECGFEIWRRRVNEPGGEDAVRGFEDVAIAASITSAARSILLRAIYSAKRPIYCDTDSLICEELRGVPIDDYELGAWKFEGDADTLAIAGKKLYAAFLNGECIKMASKGVRLEPQEIVRVARGELVTYAKPSPAFDLTGAQTFISRQIKSEARRNSEKQLELRR